MENLVKIIIWIMGQVILNTRFYVSHELFVNKRKKP